MIISRTPYRVSFFGGGTDYEQWYSQYGSLIISTTIDKYLYLSLRNLPNFFKKKNRILYSLIEETNSLRDIKLNPIKKILTYEKFKNGLEMHYDGELPAQSGVGSSSAFVVGLANICSKLKKYDQSKKKLANLSIFYEQKILKETVGIQDQIASVYGGLNYIRINKDGKFLVEKIFKNKEDSNELSKNLILIYTGVQKIKNLELKRYVNTLKYKKEIMFQTMDFVKDAKRILINKNFDDFGKLLDKSWQIKKKIDKSISNSKINLIYSQGIKNGALGGKLLGAGGGGFLLFYVPKNNMKVFKKRMINFVNIDFNIELEGTKIIYNQENNEKIV